MSRSYRGDKRVEVSVDLRILSNKPQFATCRLFDHWAHLGGAAFGLAYYYGGMKIWNTLRDATALSGVKHTSSS